MRQLLSFDMATQSRLVLTINADHFRPCFGRLKLQRPLFGANGLHDCPKCGFPMLLAIVEPSDQEGHDR